jgi:hypothetical protein
MNDYFMTVIKLIAAICGTVTSAKAVVTCARHLGLI